MFRNQVYKRYQTILLSPYTQIDNGEGEGRALDHLIGAREKQAGHLPITLHGVYILMLIKLKRWQYDAIHLHQWCTRENLHRIHIRPNRTRRIFCSTPSSQCWVQVTPYQPCLGKILYFLKIIGKTGFARYAGWGLEGHEQKNQLGVERPACTIFSTFRTRRIFRPAKSWRCFVTCRLSLRCPAS